jgi:hypothetical protein
MERALNEAGEPFHSLIYEADGRNKGKFLHKATTGTSRWISNATSYKGLLEDWYPVLVKIHGSVDRLNEDTDSFVITEDHYIEYLMRTEPILLFPRPLPLILQRSQLLFIGHSLRDWNLRVILRRLWGDSKYTRPCWAIQRAVDSLEREFWKSRAVRILDLDDSSLSLGDYVRLLETRLKDLAPFGPSELTP